MAKVIIRKDGSKMFVYSRSELHDIIKTAHRAEPPGIHAAERGR